MISRHVYPSLAQTVPQSFINPFPELFFEHLDGMSRCLLGRVEAHREIKGSLKAIRNFSVQTAIVLLRLFFEARL